MMVVCSRQKPIIKQTDQNKTPLQHTGNISLYQLRMFQTIFFTTDFDIPSECIFYTLQYISSNSKLSHSLSCPVCFCSGFRR